MPLNTYMTANTIHDSALDALMQRLEGHIILPGDTYYHQARAVWNGMIDHYPALIVRVHSASDALTAVEFARDQGLAVSVRGGGHNVAGSAVIDNGLVIDLSEMKDIQVNPIRRTARAEGGVTWGELDAATQVYNLAAPGGLVSQTGIAGLTLGGGYGSLRRKHGLTSDNLIGAEVITSDGRILNVSETEHPDLLWALRGGGSIGVVTAFEYRLHPVGPDVAMAVAFHDGENAPDALRFFRAFTENAPDEIAALAVLSWFPASDHFPAELHDRRFVLMLAPYIGSTTDGERALRPLRDFATPLLDLSGIMPFTETQQFFDADYPAGDLRYYWKSVYLDAMTDDAIDRIVDVAYQAPSHLSTVDVWHHGGAISRIDPTATAFANRSPQYMIAPEANWRHPADDNDNIAWARGANDALMPFSNGGSYLNFPGLWEGGINQLDAAWGINAAKMRQVRAQYDPYSMFTPSKYPNMPALQLVGMP